LSLEKYRQVIGEDFAKDADFIDKTIKNLGLDKSSRILDIGTGLGAMSILLALNGFSVLTGQPEEIEWGGHTHHCDTEHGHHRFALSDWKEKTRAVGVEDKITFQYLNAE